MKWLFFSFTSLPLPLLEKHQMLPCCRYIAWRAFFFKYLPPSFVRAVPFIQIFLGRKWGRGWSWIASYNGCCTQPCFCSHWRFWRGETSRGSGQNQKCCWGLGCGRGKLKFLLESPAGQERIANYQKQFFICRFRALALFYNKFASFLFMKCSCFILQLSLLL